MEVVLNGNTVKVDDLRVKLSGGVPNLFDTATPADFGAGPIPEGVDPETGEVSAKAQLDEHMTTCPECVIDDASALTQPCGAYLKLAKSLGISEEWGS